MILPKIENINKRSTQKELLDEQSFSLSEIDVIYENINKINQWLGGDVPTIKEVRKKISSFSSHKIIIVDVGSGGGGMCRALSKALQKIDKEIEIIGVDINDDAIAIARKKSQKFNNIKYQKIDVFSDDIFSLKPDIIISTLTLHHFSDKEIVDFLSHVLKLKHVSIIINDLHRSKIAFILFKMISFIFGMHEVNKYDGLLSILRSFKRSDLKRFETQLTQKNSPHLKSTIKWKWAFRWIWKLEKYER